MNHIRIAYGLRVTGYGGWGMGDGLWVTGYGDLVAIMRPKGKMKKGTSGKMKKGTSGKMKKGTSGK